MEIVNLTNQITQKQNELDEIDDAKNKIKQEQQDLQKKKLSKDSELGMILMAINNLWDKCKGREGSALKYGNIH